MSVPFWNKEWIAKLLHNFRKRAADAGLDFKLSQRVIQSMWVAQKGRCYWFKIPMTTKFTANESSRVSIDRLDNNRGYTPDNVVLTSIVANLGRRATPPDMFEAYCRKVIALRKKNEFAAVIHRGDVFDKLTAIRQYPNDKTYNKMWLFECACGNRTVMRVSSVRSYLYHRRWASCVDCYRTAGGWEGAQKRLVAECE